MYFQTGKNPSLICDSQTKKYPQHCKGTRSSLVFYCWLIKGKGTVEPVFH